MFGKRLGAGFGVFTLVASVLILLNRREKGGEHRMWLIFALLLGAAVQSMIDVCLTNVVVSIVLLFVLSGDSWFKRLMPQWGRWMEALCSMFRPWLRISVLARELKGEEERQGCRVFARSWFILKVIAPGMFLALLFVILLGQGNQVFAHGVTTILLKIGELLRFFETITAGWAFFWVVIFFAGSALLLPFSAGHPEKWAKRLPGFPEPENRLLSVLRSAFVLLILNLIFLWANSIDVLYLWFHTVLPKGVSYSQYVHHGVYSLTATVVVAGLVLSLIFHQASHIAESRWIKGLALFWIVQNLFLVMGVFLRLKMYVDVYWMTPKRAYVGVFLLLVTVGFILLTCRILMRKDLKWLILSNLTAVFVLFYVLQFLDVERWVADYSFRNWLEDPKQDLDEQFFEDVGPSGWPALLGVLKSGRQECMRKTAERLLKDNCDRERCLMKTESWQSFQYRRSVYRAKLFEGEGLYNSP